VGGLTTSGAESVIGRFRAYGVWATIKSLDFIGAAAVAAALSIALGAAGKLSVVPAQASAIMAGFAGVLIAMVLAGMSIAATSDGRFLALLVRCGDLPKIVWLYEWTLYVCFAAAVVNIAEVIWLGNAIHAAAILAGKGHLRWLAEGLIVSGVFLFAYAVLSAIMIVPATARFFIYRGEVADLFSDERQSEIAPGSTSDPNTASEPGTEKSARS
jgi:hypothetical protein